MIEEKKKLGLNWQTAAISAFLLWAGWVSGSVIYLQGTNAECRQWRSARPQFVTTADQSLALLQKEKELRDMFTLKMDAQFDSMRKSQEAVLGRLNDIDKKLAEHMAAKP